MTRQLSSSRSAKEPRRNELLRPIKPLRSLAEEVCGRLADEIAAGKLARGAKLPSETEMMQAMGVSRTVIREAVAALRARGLVVTRQGAGAFVNPDPSRQLYSIDPEGLGSLEGVIEVLELRMAIEAEAAALASERASAAQIKEILRAQEQFSRAIKAGDRAINEDFDLHQAVASATQNSRFVDFLAYLGRQIIPRQSIRSFDGQPDALRAYLQRVEKEHDAVVAAIEKREPGKAREAMRRHLLNSRERYRQLTSSQPERDF